MAEIIGALVNESLSSTTNICKGERMKRGLIIIDIQNDYFHGGDMELVGMEQAARRMQDYCLRSGGTGDSLSFISDIFQSARERHSFYLTQGALKFIRPFPLQTDEAIVEKYFPNAFRDTDLLNILKRSEVDEVVICGAMTHMCVDATTRAAFDFGIPMHRYRRCLRHPQSRT